MFRKSGIVKALVIPLCLIIGINGVYISAVLILRIPVSEYIISIGMFIYAISLLIACAYTKSKTNLEN